MKSRPPAPPESITCESRASYRLPKRLGTIWTLFLWESPGSAAKVPILPHILSQVTIWPADDEFPADARILFDKTKHGQLFAEDLPYIGAILAQALIWASGKYRPEIVS